MTERPRHAAPGDGGGLAGRALPYLLLGALGLVFFSELLLHPRLVLYSPYSDVLAEHLPLKRFLVRSYHETHELPLWNPYHFAGSPLVHDPQAGMFYPPHWVLLALPEEFVGAALSWLTVLHVLLAGWAMHLYARWRGLVRPACFVAAMGWMFAGKWMLHLLAGGHYVTVGVAWLPLLLLGMERAICRRSLVDATWSGVVLGLVVLGTHPQWTFYAGIFAAVWTAGTAFERRGSPAGAGPETSLGLSRFITPWALTGLWVSVIALSLSAVQLLPTLEAASLSTRSAGVDTAGVASDGVRTLFGLVGPALRAGPSSLLWEGRGGFGVIWIVAAMLSLLVRNARTRFQAAVCLSLIVFSIGGALALQGLPGFRAFRVPSRMLLIAAFPIAFLAGITTDALSRTAMVTAAIVRRRRELFAVAGGIVAATSGVMAVLMTRQGVDLFVHPYWVTLVITLPLAWWLLGRPMASPPLLALWIAVLLVDLWSIARPFVDVRSEREIYAASEGVRIAESVARGARLLDRDGPGPDDGSPLGVGAPVALIRRIESLRGYNPLDYLRYKNYLQFITDENRQLRPLDGPLTFPVMRDFPIVNKPLLDLLGVRCLLQPGNEMLAGSGWRFLYRDDEPASYNVVTGGLRPLPPYHVYENTDAFPRVIVVGSARSWTEEGDVLHTLKNTEFSREVLLTGWEGSLVTAGYSRKATVQAHLPNRVLVRVEEGPPGFVVLLDPWYPGWTSEVNGIPSPVYRANYLFRATPVGAGAADVVFSFAPPSYRRGRAVSATALAVVALILLVPWMRRARPEFRTAGPAGHDAPNAKP